MNQNPDELMPPAVDAAPGQPEVDPVTGQPVMPAPPAPSPTRDPRVMRLELRLTGELIARHAREDLMPPESLMDTPNRVEFPILRAPREDVAPLPPARMNFLDQLPPDLLGGMDAAVMGPDAAVDGVEAPGEVLEGAPAPVPGVGGEPAEVVDDLTLPPGELGGF